VSAHYFARAAAYRQRALACELERYLLSGHAPQALLDEYEVTCAECRFYGQEVGRG
jgi:hypothetical protein